MATSDVDVDRVRRRAQDAICNLMLDNIRRDTHPSPTMMNIVESHMTEDRLPEYLGLLLDKIDGEQNPSLDMVRRILRLT